MSKNEDLQKHTLNLFAGDYDRLQALFPDLSAAVVIRKIVREFADKCEAGTHNVPNIEVDI